MIDTPPDYDFVPFDNTYDWFTLTCLISCAHKCSHLVAVIELNALIS